jgi:predicted enzyme related to lactoylglutathione lyase
MARWVKRRMNVTSIAFTSYPGKDVPKLLAFYRDVLGLRVDRLHPNEEEARLVEFDIGNDHWFTLMPDKMLERPAGSGSGVVFEVDDIEGMLNKVRPHAKSVGEIADYPSCRMTSFEDPEGNRVGLHQKK